MIWLFLAVLVGVAFISFAPIFTIWALNLLFGTGISFTFWTWLSTLWLMSFFGCAAAGSKK